jgi:histidinol dehydrogenase
MMRRVVLAELTAGERAALLARSAVPSAEVRASAADIVASVRGRGDTALADANDRFGGGSGEVIGEDVLAEAAAGLGSELTSALQAAIANVRTFHSPQRPEDSTVTTVEGVVVERRWTPLRRVGAYVPGGSAPLPSTLIMTVVPAQAAGVGSVVVATPAGVDGTINPVLLGTAALLGVSEVRAMGGAQAIGALAYGTETIQPVDKIVGPGNAWVTAAKLAVAGECSIDMPAGPSEALVLVDGAADPVHAAADLLAQAEHGPDSPVVLIGEDQVVLESVVAAAEALLGDLGRREVITKALGDHGLVVLADSIAEAIEFADGYGPEHVSIHLADPTDAVDRITSAGSVYVGEWSPEPVGDYATGANHVLPTGGLACSTSPLGVEDFGSWRQVQTLTHAGLAALRPTVSTLAAAEGLDAHRLAVEIRFRENL